MDNRPLAIIDSGEINRRLVLIFNWLLQKNCQAVVIACNTITASSIKFLRRLYSLPIIGTEPAIKPALRRSKLMLVSRGPARLPQFILKDV
ncbi:MAG: Glutamate racemase [Candidatus Beckwithbacteria bacterium GW2011_GWA2_43_10]|uniref:Glutamate racemase n=1 Tax=Candidatus Beckwithbacteria bacterium GW2011_GWA2_43_10 TaxID=1618369 RepID=A0A0G1C3H3_9BACT|nr:MAG: Glutamate racemase [Candidatus Beckwithbacteria bacterium GW2011_GWA2_43_10]